jgi:threonine dehydratase
MRFIGHTCVPFIGIADRAFAPWCPDQAGALRRLSSAGNTKETAMSATLDSGIHDIRLAQGRIRDVADNTPLIPSPYMGQIAGHDFLMKMENMQPIGAFKLRGALSAVMALPEGVTGVTCCSTGNHGHGVAFAAEKRGIRAVICMSELVPQAKVDGIRALGAEVRIVGQSQDEI